MRYLGAKEYKRRRDFMKAFEYVVSRVLELKPDILLISGDLYDRVNPRNPARTFVMKAFRKISQEGIKVFAIGGNHDTPRSIEEGASPLHEIEASGYIRFFSKTNTMEADHYKVGGLDVCISGASFNHSLPYEKDPLETLSIPLEGDINIAMLHYNFNPVKTSPIWRAPTIKETAIPRGLHYLALGHFHGFREIKIGDTCVVYPGSTERRTFAEEAEEKGFVYFEICEEGVRSLERFKTPSRPLKTIEITLTEKDENPIEKVVASALKCADKNVVARLRIQGRLPLRLLTKYRRELILRRLEEKFFYVVIEDRNLGYMSEEVGSNIADILNPLRLYEEYLERLLKKAEEKRDAETKRILEKALELGKRFLEEVGVW